MLAVIGKALLGLVRLYLVLTPHDFVRRPLPVIHNFVALTTILALSYLAAESSALEILPVPII